MVTARPADPPGAPRTGAPGVLPLAALVLARRVRALVAVTVVHTIVLAVAAWVAGNGPTLPSVAALAAHLAISLAAALPVRWQFAGDPAVRERRAVRAMTVSFVVLAVYSAVDAVADALTPGRPGETLVGGLLGLAAAVALPLLVAADARTARAQGADRDPRVRPAAPDRAGRGAVRGAGRGVRRRPPREHGGGALAGRADRLGGRGRARGPGGAGVPGDR